MPANSASQKSNGSFHTFQDRLIKELRPAGIATRAEANQFVEAWVPRYNQRCAVPLALATDLGPVHRHVSWIAFRVLRRDGTMAHHGQLYQIQDHVRATQVLVEEHTMRITHHDRTLDYHVIAGRHRSIRGANGCCRSEARRRRRR